MVFVGSWVIVVFIVILLVLGCFVCFWWIIIWMMIIMGDGFKFFCIDDIVIILVEVIKDVLVLF